MFRPVGVVAALLCVLTVVPAAAQSNIAPPGWTPVGPSADPKGVTGGNANINDAVQGSERSVSVGIGAGAAAGAIVVYRQSNPSTNKLELLVKRFNANTSVYEQMGGALNTTDGNVSEPKLKVSAAGDIFVAWRQVVEFGHFALYLSRWSGAAWVPLAGADPDGRVTTAADVPNTIKDFDVVLDADGHPILAFQTPATATCTFDEDPAPACSDQIYVMSCDVNTGCGFHGGGPNDGGGASNAKSFMFPLDAPTFTAFHGAVGPGVASDPSGHPVVTFFYTNVFDTSPAGFQNNQDDVYVKRWDGTKWVAVGPAVPEPGSTESLGAAGGISATNAFGTKSGFGGARTTKAPPSLAVDQANGDILLAWGEGGGNTNDAGDPFTWIRVALFDGNDWFELGPPAVADFNGTASNFFPSVGFYGDLGTPMVLWQHYTNNLVNVVSSIYARQFQNDSTWGEMGLGSATAAGGGVGGTLSTGFAPALAFGPAPSNVPYAVWIEQGISFPPQVFLRQYTAVTDLPPAISAFSPTSGPVGTDVILTGTNFDTVFDVFVDGIQAGFHIDSPTQITLTIPQGAHTGRITVFGPGGMVPSATTFKVTPKIVSFSPTSAVAGQTVTMFGFNLRIGVTDAVVKVNGVIAALTGGVLGGETSQKFIVPAGASTGLVTLTTADGTGTSTNNLVIVKPPQVTSLTPAFGAVNTLVTARGSGLQGLQFISFKAFAPLDVTDARNVSRITEFDGTRADFQVPFGATTGLITFLNAAGSVNSSIFKVTPLVSDIFPTEVVAGSDIFVTVEGMNLFQSPTAGPPTVKVGDVTIPAANVLGPLRARGPGAAPAAAANAVNSPVRFRVPLGAPSGKVTINTADGSGTSGVVLNVIQPPKIVSFMPAMGPVGTLVTLTGTGLNRSTLVTFGGNVSAAPTQVTPTSLKVTVPDGALSGMLRVTNPATTGASTGIFKVTPKITGFTPASVVAGSGTPVTITGRNLTALTGANTVKVGTFTVPTGLVLANSSTSIQFTVPLGAITGKISVTTVDGAGVSATDLVVIQPPKPTAFTPASGPVGTLVTISGANFSGNVSVTFGGNVTVAAQLISATMVRAVVPDGALTGKLSVTNEAGTGTTVGIFKVSPRITGFTPASVVAGSGTPVTITGSNLQALTGANTVKVGTFTIPFAAVLANSSTSITFAVPLGAITGKVGVTTADGTGLSVTNLVVIQPPKVTSFTPASGPVGTLVTISGANFGGNVSVTFGGNVTAAATLISAVSAKASVPDGALTGPITVANEAGTSTSVASFKVSPKITGFSPASVPVGGTDVVTVTGVNLLAASGVPVVKVGAFTIPAASVLGNSSTTTIQFLVTPGAVTGKISVTTIDGSGTSASDLVVIQPPRVSGFTPAAAPVGSEVTVTGSNFTGVTDVTFSALPLDIISGSVGGPVPFLNRIGAEIVSVTPTALKVRVPAGAINGPIEVVNAAGSALSTQQFKVPPGITSFDPLTGNAGDSIVVMGYNLQSSGPNGPTPPTVKVNGVPAEVTAASATGLTFTIPGLARTGPITVTTVDGTATSPGSLVVTTPVVPDLKVASVSGPAAAIRSTAAKPQTLSVATTVTNQGLGAAAPFGVAIQLLASDGVTLRTIGTRTVTALASGATAMATTVVTLPVDLAPGVYELHAVADVPGVVTELNENNNEAVALQPVRIVDAVAGAYGFNFFLDSSPCLSVPGGGVILATGSGTMTQTLDRFTVASLALTSGQLNLTLTSFTATLDEAGQVLPGTFGFRTVIQGTTVTGTGQFSGFETNGAFDVSFTAQTTSPAGCSFMGTASFAPH